MLLPRRIETPATRADTPRLNILIVEDNLDGANSLALLLRNFGYEVEIAQNGPAALKMAEEQSPDVVLLDIGLPGMSGFEVGAPAERALAEQEGDSDRGERFRKRWRSAVFCGGWYRPTSGQAGGPERVARHP